MGDRKKQMGRALFAAAILLGTIGPSAEAALVAGSSTDPNVIAVAGRFGADTTVGQFLSRNEIPYGKRMIIPIDYQSIKIIDPKDLDTIGVKILDFSNSLGFGMPALRTDVAAPGNGRILEPLPIKRRVNRGPGLTPFIVLSLVVIVAAFGLTRRREILWIVRRRLRMLRAVKRSRSSDLRSSTRIGYTD